MIPSEHIALYLSGRLEGHLEPKSRFRVIFVLQTILPGFFTDEKLSHYKDKSDFELYRDALSHLETSRGKETDLFQRFCNEMPVPPWVIAGISGPETAATNPPAAVSLPRKILIVEDERDCWASLLSTYGIDDITIMEESCADFNIERFAIQAQKQFKVHTNIFRIVDREALRDTQKKEIEEDVSAQYGQALNYRFRFTEVYEFENFIFLPGIYEKIGQEKRVVEIDDFIKDKKSWLESFFEGTAATQSTRFSENTRKKPSALAADIREMRTEAANDVLKRYPGKEMKKEATKNVNLGETFYGLKKEELPVEIANLLSEMAEFFS